MSFRVTFALDPVHVLLQFAELPPAQRLRFAVVGVQALDSNDLGAPDARRQQMPGNVVLPTLPEKLMTAIFIVDLVHG